MDMNTVDYKQKIYLLDDRNKSDFIISVNNIIFQNDKYILCETFAISIIDANLKMFDIEEPILIDKQNNCALNVDYQFWYVSNLKI